MNRQQAAILRGSYYPEEVKINMHSQAECPYCKKLGTYAQDGQAADDKHRFVWEKDSAGRDILVAVDK